MEEINLREYERSAPLRLSVEKRDELIRATSEIGVELIIQPVNGTRDEYTLTPGATIGAFETESCSVCISPKLTIRQVVSLLCYAIGHVRFQEDEFGFPEEEAALPDVLALALGAAARRCFSRGLLQGYRTTEESLYAVRGRIRLDDQIRQRSGVLLPIEVRYDEFTDDILPNRLIKAAALRLRGMPLLSTDATRQLASVAEMLDGVAHVEFPRNSVPEVKFDRLNEHYRSVVTLARLILRHGMFEANRGTVRASGLVVDMTRFFQEFVTVALRIGLRVSEHEKFGEHHIRSLDENGLVKLRPDLTWWEGDDCVFVGDVKYKRTNGGVPNADLYQLLAYVTALDLPGGVLVYAKGEAKPTIHTVRHSNKRLDIIALNLSGSLDKVLSRVDAVGKRASELRRAAKRHRRAA